jgi:pyruvate,water dikinase
MSIQKNILFFNEIAISDIAKVGGKNASLGEMYSQLNPMGITIPNGFAVTAEAYRLFRKEDNLEQKLIDLIKTLDTIKYSNLETIGRQARTLISNTAIPESLVKDLNSAYKTLSEQCNSQKLDVAVRSSATSEDLPLASFAGQMESYLNITGEAQLLEALHRCYVSLFTDRAIKYRHDMGFINIDIAISVGVQQMVRSDKASSGVAFTIDPDTGFENTIIINGIWGLGENIVQGRVTPDEWMVFKPTLQNEKLNPILKRNCGRKEFTLVYADNSEAASAEKTIETGAKAPKKRANCQLFFFCIILPE